MNDTCPAAFYVTEVHCHCASVECNQKEIVHPTTSKGVLLVKLIEPPCTEWYARWCERSEISQLEEFPPTRFCPFLNSSLDTKHKRYKELADYYKKNEFAVEKYLEHKLVLSKNKLFEVFETEVIDEDLQELEKDMMEGDVENE